MTLVYTADELHRMALRNDPQIPATLRATDRRFAWNGIGWDERGAALGDEAGEVADPEHFRPGVSKCAMV